MEQVYQITASYACYAIVVKDGIVDFAAPIAKWMLGKSFEKQIIPWLMKKGASFILVFEKPLDDRKVSNTKGSDNEELEATR